MNDNPGLPVPASGPAVTGVAAVETRQAEPQDAPFCCYHGWFAPHVTDVTADLLTWLDRRGRRTVFNPETRTWLKYDPLAGIFKPVSGTAEQAARVLIAEAADSARQRFDATVKDGNAKHAYLWTWKLLTEYEHHPEDATVSDIARAMVDTAAGGARADATRKQLADGRRPDLMFNPMTISTGGDLWAHAPVDPFWSGDKCRAILWDAYTDDDEEAGYYAIPVRAARYVPDFDAEHPLFNKLCALITSDSETLLRLFSMGCTGIATKFVIYLIAETGQGKSLVAALLSDLLGGYARSVPAKNLFGYNADPQFAADELDGTWLAIVEEGIGGQSFRADETFKLMTTGGGDLNTRKRHERESRQETATHTILLAVNPEAGMNYADPAIMARLCPVRFTGSPAEIAKFAETYNPSTEAWRREAPAVLATLLRYAHEFASGAWRPDTLADLTAAGQHEALDDDLAFAVEMKTSDNVAAFIEANRLLLADEKMFPEGHRARDLYQRYERWAALSGGAVSETAFGRALPKVDGVTKEKGRDANRYHVAKPPTQAIGQ